MCIKDWQVGRLIRSVARNVTVGASSVSIVGSDKQRAGIYFWNSGTTTIFVGDTGTMAVNTGIALETLTDSKQYSLPTYGDFATHAFDAIGSGAGGNLYVVELMLTESALALDNEELRKLGLIP